VFGDGKEQNIKKDYPHSLLSGKEKDHLKDIMFTSSGRGPRSSSSVSLS
jgi:hypothetical protein